MGKYGGWKFLVSETATAVDVKMSLKLAILDITEEKKTNLNALGRAVERQLKKTYQISYITNAIGGQNVINIKSGLDGYHNRRISLPVKKNVYVSFNMQYRIVTKERQRMSDEHLLEIHEDVGMFRTIYGRANSLGGNKVQLNVRFVPDMIGSIDNNTLPHEFGHTLTLLHVNEGATLKIDKNQFFSLSHQYFSKDTTNIMFKGGSSQMNDLTSITIIGLQMDIIIRNYRRGLLNQG